MMKLLLLAILTAAVIAKLPVVSFTDGRDIVWQIDIQKAYPNGIATPHNGRMQVHLLACWRSDQVQSREERILLAQLSTQDASVKQLQLSVPTTNYAEFLHDRTRIYRMQLVSMSPIGIADTLEERVSTEELMREIDAPKEQLQVVAESEPFRVVPVDVYGQQTKSAELVAVEPLVLEWLRGKSPQEIQYTKQDLVDLMHKHLIVDGNGDATRETAKLLQLANYKVNKVVHQFMSKRLSKHGLITVPNLQTLQLHAIDELQASPVEQKKQDNVFKLIDDLKLLESDKLGRDRTLKRWFKQVLGQIVHQLPEIAAMLAVKGLDTLRKRYLLSTAPDAPYIVAGEMIEQDGLQDAHQKQAVELFKVTVLAKALSMIIKAAMRALL